MNPTGPESTRGKEAGKAPARWGQAAVKNPYQVRISRPADVAYVERIQSLIAEAAESGAIIAERSAEYLEQAIRARHAVVVLRGDLLVGFATAHAWQDETFVSHSAMVVAPAFRGRGLARRIKKKLIDLSRRRWPDAAILSLTLSPAVERLNKSFKFDAVPYCDLTTDAGFWKGCEGCIHYGHLKRNQYQDCHCWAGLLLPRGAERDRVIPKDALRRDDAL